MSKTISGRIILAVLGVHVVVLPALYFGLVFLLEKHNEEMFLNTARGYARFLADDLERIDDITADAAIVEVLDSVVLSGIGVYSRLEGNNREYVSSLTASQDTADYEEDFAIGDHGDDVYFISVPVFISGEMLSFRVGFDERPYLENNALAHRNGLILVGLYLCALLLVLPLVSRRVTRPVRSLQKASRDIASGKLTGSLSAETDLIEFVELAEDLELMKSRLIGMNEQLKQQILEREQAETERRSLELQLRHSQRLETVGTMAGGIAHNLNNILVPIILYTDMAIEDLPKGSSTVKDMTSILRAAKRAKALVSQVLTFSHKMTDHENVPIDLSEVVREAAELVKATMPPTVTLKTNIGKECPPVLGDSSLLNQLVLNLLTNALQSLRNATGSVEISLYVAEANSKLKAKYPGLADRELVRLTVRDTGHGMDRATKNRIFEPFFTTRRVGEGTGLGLSVVHGIVTDLNGAIEVESEVNSGSTFIVCFPAIDARMLPVNDTTSGLAV